MRDQLSICNGALDELPAGTITDINDPDDVGARACKRRYSAVFEDLLDEHNQGYEGAMARAIGAPLTNDREGEWRYCYAVPTAARTIKRVLPTYAASFTSSAVILQPGQHISLAWGYYPRDEGVPYVVAAGKLYTNMAEATIEFVAADPPLQLLSPLFHRAFEFELAARICMPVLKSKTRWRELQSASELARQRAMADDLNNSPKRYDAWPSEEARVRAGVTDLRGWYS